VKKAVGIIFAVIFIPAISAFSQETFTLTTYYPAPFGVYNELRTKRLAIGQSYFDNSIYPWDNDGSIVGNEIPQDVSLVIEGKVGINTIAPWDDFEVKATNSEGRIQLDPSNSLQSVGIELRTEKGINPSGDQAFIDFTVDADPDYNPIPSPGSPRDFDARIIYSERGASDTLYLLAPDIGMAAVSGGALASTTLHVHDKLAVGTNQTSDGTRAGGQDLSLDVEGAVGATHYCDENGENCVEPPIVSGPPQFVRANNIFNQVGGTKTINVGNIIPGAKAVLLSVYIFINACDDCRFTATVKAITADYGTYVIGFAAGGTDGDKGFGGSFSQALIPVDSDGRIRIRAEGNGSVCSVNIIGYYK